MTNQCPRDELFARRVFFKSNRVEAIVSTPSQSATSHFSSRVSKAKLDGAEFCNPSRKLKGTIFARIVLNGRGLVICFQNIIFWPLHTRKTLSKTQSCSMAPLRSGHFAAKPRGQQIIWTKYLALRLQTTLLSIKKFYASPNFRTGMYQRPTNNWLCVMALLWHVWSITLVLHVMLNWYITLKRSIIFAYIGCHLHSHTLGTRDTKIQQQPS